MIDELDSTVPDPSRGRPTRQDDPRFLPGTVLDRRYRIVAPLGRGGMGEVYRADDLKLGHPVALKFLPRALQSDAAGLALLLDEVKVARQVSHPNVCRVWDIGQAEDLHFVAMEYVDGEDLGSLLRRIGRLPEERGVQIAREICVGLAAIHDQGVLHRDLKPANVMLDGRGRVRIADFGLATLAGAAGDGTRSGTPAYMAPEQLADGTVTERSDLYSLGLLLYEVFTGHHAFASGRVPFSPGVESRPESPSSHVRSLDPVVERAILRCLESDPALRPASALSVAHALPGGNPLLSALAAGETPSPEMVAASGGAGGLPAVAALGLVAAIALGVAGTLVLSERRGLPFGPEDPPYAALRDRAAAFVRTLGATHPDDDVVDGFSREIVHGGGAGTPAPGVFYWYRRSPVPVARVLEERVFQGGSQFAIPALEVPGELALRFDLRGRLLEFRFFPTPADTQAHAEPDWRSFFTAAGLDGFHRAPTLPKLVPPVPTQAGTAWTVETGHETRRVEGGSDRGRVTFFVAGAPYAASPPTRAAMIGSTFTALIPVLLLGLALYFARRNLLAGRADVRGTVRLIAVLSPLGMLGWKFLANPRNFGSGQILFLVMASGLFFTVLMAFAYLALEPIVRRQHPEWLVSWTRLLDGRWLDRLVGRDLLMGLAGGVLAALIGEVRGYLTKLSPAGDLQAAGIGGWSALAVVLRGISLGALISTVLALILALLQRSTRRNVLGWILWIPVAASFLWGGLASQTLWAPVLEAAVLGVVLHRSGLLGLAAAIAAFSMMNDEFLTVNPGVWYGGVTVAVLLATGVLIGWGSIAATRSPRSIPHLGGV